MEGKKLAVLCVLWSVLGVAECVWRNGTRRRRSETCPEGPYEAQNGFQCCSCPKGYYVESDCSSPGGNAQCSVCEKGTYMDHVNSERKCELCKVCSSNENMEVETPCSASANTVCRCQNEHYCPRGRQCSVCYPCNTCEGFGVKAPCTLTNDTQCNEESPAVLPAGVVAVIVLSIVAALLFFLSFFFWRKKKFCFKSLEIEKSSEVFELLDDPDLEPFLPRIAEILGFRTVRKVVKRQGLLPQSRVDNIMEEYPHDANERAHQLLLAWYQKHGLNGAYRTLNENLVAINMKVEAEKVQKLIQDGRRHRETEQNGVGEIAKETI